MFRKITDAIYASPQITADQIAEAKTLGIAMVINNRPDGESDDQPAGADIEAVAREAGMDYIAIPVTHAGFSMGQVEAMESALNKAAGPVLAFCRSGTRSTLLWSLTMAKEGMDPDMIASLAAGAGYDVSPIRPQLDMLAADKA